MPETSAMDDEIRAIVADIRDRERREDAAVAAFTAGANRLAAERINAAIAEHGSARVCVTGVRVYPDALSDSGYRVHEVCDYGRTGVVTTPVQTDGAHAYVEQMSAGDDGCPTRYHEAGSLTLIDDDTPAAPPQAMRVEAIAFWTDADEVAVADAAETVIAAMGHAVAVEPDDDYGTVFLMREHDRPNYRLRPDAVVAVLATLAD